MILVAWIAENYVLSKVDVALKPGSDSYNEIKGQALFLRALAYYELATYYQRVPLFIDYAQYSSLETMYAANVDQDTVFDQIDADLLEAMSLLPSRDKGGEWAKGRATCGSAAGYLARSYMFRHKFEEAYTVLKDIIAGKYGNYDLMPDYGDNFKEGAEFENNKESLAGKKLFLFISCMYNDEKGDRQCETVSNDFGISDAVYFNKKAEEMNEAGFPAAGDEFIKRL